jgi:hypothetical protein
MSAGDIHDALTPAESRLAQHLELLRASPPAGTPHLVQSVIRAARWQRVIRDPLVLVGMMGAALAEGLGLLLERPADRS